MHCKEHLSTKINGLTTMLSLEQSRFLENVPVKEFLEEHEFLEKLSLAYMARAMAMLDITSQTQEDHVQLPAKHEQIVNCYKRHLRKAGLQLTVNEADVLIDKYKRLAVHTHFISNELNLLQSCGPHISAVLHGDIHPLQLLFPSGDLSLTQGIYKDSLPSKTTQTLLKACLEFLINSCEGDQLLQILEVGAGEGATAKQLAGINKTNFNYVVTDVSRLFLQKAKDNLENNSLYNFDILNIEEPPSNFRSKYQTFDVIVASNVLHATRSLDETLQNVHSLLANGGFLLIFEETEQQAWLDATFGLTDGWWRFSDYEFRTETPLLSREAWLKLLQKHGFEFCKYYVPCSGWPSTFFLAVKD